MDVAVIAVWLRELVREELLRIVYEVAADGLALTGDYEAPGGRAAVFRAVCGHWRAGSPCVVLERPERALEALCLGCWLSGGFWGPRRAAEGCTRCGERGVDLVAVGVLDDERALVVVGARCRDCRLQ